MSSIARAVGVVDEPTAALCCVIAIVARAITAPVLVARSLSRELFPRLPASLERVARVTPSSP